MPSLIDVASREGEELKAALRALLAGSQIRETMGGVYAKAWVDVGPPLHTPLIEAHQAWGAFRARLDTILYGQLPGPVFARKLELERALDQVINQGEGHDFVTTGEAAAHACECVSGLLDLANALPSAGDSQIVVPDTNVLIEQPRLHQWAIEGVDTFRIVLVPAVLREIDAHSKSKTERLSQPARCVRNFIKELRRRSSDVVVAGRSKLSLWSTEVTGAVATGLDPADKDDRVLAGFLDVQRRNPRAAAAILTNDLMMIAKAEARRISLTELKTRED